MVMVCHRRKCPSEAKLQSIREEHIQQVFWAGVFCDFAQVMKCDESSWGEMRILMSVL
jgi:hypothetical protein